MELKLAENILRRCLRVAAAPRPKAKRCSHAPPGDVRQIALLSLHEDSHGLVF
jgi:hypothetical protein